MDRIPVGQQTGTTAMTAHLSARPLSVTFRSGTTERRAPGAPGRDPGSPVICRARQGRLAPVRRVNAAIPAHLSTMRNGAGRLRNVAAGHGPARRLTFRI